MNRIGAVRWPEPLGADIIARRQNFIEENTPAKLDHTRQYSFDPADMSGNIENLFGGIAHRGVEPAFHQHLGDIGPGPEQGGFKPAQGPPDPLMVPGGGQLLPGAAQVAQGAHQAADQCLQIARLRLDHRGARAEGNFSLGGKTAQHHRHVQCRGSTGRHLLDAG